MNTPAIGFVVAIVVIVGIYFLYVVPGERKYHETKLRLMRERIEKHERRQRDRQSSTPHGDSSAPGSD